MLKKFTLIIPLILLLSFKSISIAQEASILDDGTEITVYDSIISFYDPFTDLLTIRSKGFDIPYQAFNGEKFRLMPVFSGTKECDEKLCGEFVIRIILEESSITDYFGLSDRNFIEEIFASSFPILFDDFRDNVFVSIISNEDMGEMLKTSVTKHSSSSAIDIHLDWEQYYLLKNSGSSKIRIEGIVIEFGESLKTYFSHIEEILTEVFGQDVNKINIIGTEASQTAPYEIKWEGNIPRDPVVQTLPENTNNFEGNISVRFQVKPGGTVGLIIPLEKTNSELEKEIKRTLRNWRFTNLPTGVPQQIQWGSITFRFVAE